MDAFGEEIAAGFREYSCRRLGQMAEQMEACMVRLTDAQVWQRQGVHENTVGNLVLHLCGNMRQWVMHGVGRQADVRVRDTEFGAEGGLSGAELMGLFRGLWRYW